jgi:hypothetical protein
MTATMIAELKKVTDFRTKQGQRHPLWNETALPF